LVSENLEKARQSAILAVETYNRPSIAFRTHAYIVLMQIAWTGLLHAIFWKNKIKPFYRSDTSSKRYKKIDGEPKCWELDECIKQLKPPLTEAVKKNLQFFIKLRNKIEHRELPSLDHIVLGECQAHLFNFEDLLEREFGADYALCESLTIPIQLTKTRDKARMEALRNAMKPLPEDVYNFIKTFRSSLSNGVASGCEFSYKIFLVPNVKTNFTRDALAVEFIPYDPSKHDEYDSIVTALIKEKTISVSNLDKFKPGQVVKLVTEAIPGLKFNVNLHSRAWQIFGIRPLRKTGNPERCNTKYCVYDKVHDDWVYTKQWVDFLILNLKDEKFVDALSSKQWVDMKGTSPK